jgi:hypothetical protein
MIVGGVHLDHAWTGLGARFGSALRSWSRQVLALVVEEGNRRSAGVLVIAGDLFDRSYALPGTIDYASQILETFGGDVLIVPGRSDWIDGASLYSTHTWAPNIWICPGSDYRASELATSVWASAWTSPGGSAPRVPDAPGPRVLVRADLNETDLGRLNIGSDDLVVTTGASVGSEVLTVRSLVHDPRDPGGFALLIDSADSTKPAQQIDLPNQPGLLVDVDVTDETSTDALAGAIEAVLATESPLMLRLLGTLAPGVLLPGFGGPDLPPEVVLDAESLSFATPPVDQTDRSARAEFLRAMAYANTPALQQHQTTALGLAALDVTGKGV